MKADEYEIEPIEQIDTTDVNGEEIQRGDWVRMAVSQVVLDPSVGKLGSGQVIHVFTDSIHVQFRSGVRRGTSGKCFEKVSRPEL